ncbi:MAG: hypothetical protein E6I51_00890 [Chloroflexi bacterium]|nr:MAG: hypothetical protein E6I51_00890 [Chloroflexota bacterium]
MTATATLPVLNHIGGAWVVHGGRFTVRGRGVWRFVGWRGIASLLGTIRGTDDETFVRGWYPYDYYVRAFLLLFFALFGQTFAAVFSSPGELLFIGLILVINFGTLGFVNAGLRHALESALAEPARHVWRYRPDDRDVDTGADS